MGDINKVDEDICTQNSFYLQLVEAKWKAILSRYPEAEFVWLQFLLFEGSLRLRMIPVAYFSKMIENNCPPSLSSAYLHILRNDAVAKEAASTGEMYLVPDISTASVSAGDSSRIHILSNLVDSNQTPRPECLRTKVSSLSETLSQIHEFYILVGYEIEVIFFTKDDKDDISPLPDHKCSGLTTGGHSILPMVEAIVRTLKIENILLEQFHPEMTPGQWEFVLQPQNPLEAADTLIKARRIISKVSADYGYGVTLHPRPYPEHGGTGAHLHLSVNRLKSSSTHSTDPFFAGIVKHFPSLMAFCLPLDICYERVAAGIWSGGEYVCWGSQNKETPLRRISNNRFEFKLHCGMANPHVSLAAIIAAGIDGLNKDLLLTAGDCQTSPSAMSEEQRTLLGIRPVPRNLQQSLGNLVEDESLKQILGEQYTSTYISVSAEWNQQLNDMNPEDRRRVLLESY